MKAMVHTQYGPPDVLQLAEVEKPAPRDTEVLIKIYAATVNRTDCGFLRAAPFIVRFFSGLMKPKNTILGSEFAGQIDAVGKGVTSFRVGDRVFGFNGVTFGPHYSALRQEESLISAPDAHQEGRDIHQRAHRRGEFQTGH